jgi:hypothetical protein
VHKCEKKEFVARTSALAKSAAEKGFALTSVGGADFDAICIAIVILLAQLVRLPTEKLRL